MTLQDGVDRVGGDTYAVKLLIADVLQHTTVSMTFNLNMAQDAKNNYSPKAATGQDCNQT